jgi:hypothetical protein
MSGNLGTTKFDLDNKVFNAPGARFFRDTLGNVVFEVQLGAVRGAIALQSLRRNFDIDPQSRDDRMLDAVDRGIKYVNEIRPGDDIPSELLDGSASWRVTDAHLALALNTLMEEVKTIGRDSPEGAVLDDEGGGDASNDELQRGLETIVARLPAEAKMSAAEARDALEKISREFAYIEALREKLNGIRKIMRSVKDLRKSAARDRSVAEEIDRIIDLIKVPIRDYNERFQQVDGQVKEVGGLLGNVDRHIAFIRSTRDDIRVAFLDWEPIINAWEAVGQRRSSADEDGLPGDVIRQTYRFAARHFRRPFSWRMG